MALQYHDEMMANMADEYGESEYDYEEDEDQDEENDNGEGFDANSDEFEDGDSQTKGSQSSDGESGEDEVDANGKFINHDKFSHPGDKDQFDPKCRTDENYRRNETQLLDDKCKEFVYVDIPKPNLKNIITPAKRVQELMTKSFNEFIREGYIKTTTPTALVNEFKRRNERYVSLLAKEFEMRKAAKAFSKSKLSDTGDIDVNKLASYKFDDNIFRKVMMTPKGKNHGLILLLDRSGSMSNNMSGSIEQILVLSMFCRKVNIPFVVYGFTENENVRVLDLGVDRVQHLKNVEEHNSFSNNIGEIKFGNVHLREYLNSKMSNVEFSSALKNMCLLMDAYKERYSPRPESESMNNTPMTQAIVAIAEVMKTFKRINNLDICSLVVIHDGDADHANGHFIEEERMNKQTNLLEKIKCVAWFGYDKVYMMRDRQNKFEVKISGLNDIPAQTLKWFNKVTGARIFGFFIVTGRGEAKYAISNQYVNEEGKNFWEIQNEMGREHAEQYRKRVLKEFKEEKFISCRLQGYENFFFIHGGTELTTEDEDGIEVEGKFTARKLATAFAKYNKKRAVNRVLVSRFIQGIAA